MPCKSQFTPANIRIESPCDADWSAMEVKDQARFCTLCSQDVHDLSSMPHDEALELLSTEDELCVRVSCTPDGEIQFENTPTPGLRRARRPRLLRRSVQLVAIAALSLVGGRAQANEGELESPGSDVVGDATSWVVDRVTEFIEMVNPEDEPELQVKGRMDFMGGASFEPVPEPRATMGRPIYRPPVEVSPAD